MNQPRLPWTEISPKSYQAMAGVNGSLAKSTLGHSLMELVQTRVSQINGCAFCLDMHARDLRKHGETWQRLNSLSTWREVSFYTSVNARPWRGQRCSRAWPTSTATRTRPTRR